MYEHLDTIFADDLSVQDKFPSKTLGEGNELAKAQLKHEQDVK